MRTRVRMLLFLVVALAMALPMAIGFGARSGAEAATRPCPTQMVLKACVAGAASDLVLPRGAAAVDAPCHGKAIGIQALALAVPTRCDPLAFERASTKWSAWSPPTPAPPPRS